MKKVQICLRIEKTTTSISVTIIQVAIRYIVSIIVSVDFIIFKSRKREGAIGSCNILLRIRYMFMAIQIMSWIT